MNASKLFAAVAAVVFAGSAVAADLPVASAAAAGAAATQLSYATQKLNVPVVQVNKAEGPSRAEVRAEAIAAMNSNRSTFAAQLDFLKN
jgi:hypothetical protein